MLKRAVLFLAAIFSGCINVYDSGGSKNEGGPGFIDLSNSGFIDLRKGATWNYECLNYGRFNGSDSTRRGVKLLEINPGSRDSSYVFEVNDSLYSDRHSGRVDSMKLDTIYKKNDTAIFQHSFGTASGSNSAINNMSFFPPTPVILDSQITIEGVYSGKVGKTVNLNGTDINSATYFQKSNWLQGTDSIVFLQGVGLYYREFNWSGGITGQRLVFKLWAHNGKPIIVK
jgi:hypothetical protein